MNAAPSKENPMSKLPSKADFQYAIKNITSSMININPYAAETHRFYCDFCFYIIGYYATVKSNIRILAHLPESPFYLKSGYSIFDLITVGERIYNYEVSTQKEIEISMNILSGSPILLVNFFPSSPVSRPYRFTGDKGNFIVYRTPKLENTNFKTMQVTVRQNFTDEERSDLSYILSIQNVDTILQLAKGIYDIGTAIG